MRHLFPLLALAFAAANGATHARAAEPDATGRGVAHSTQEETARTAQAFLATLNAEQRRQVVYDFDDAAQRARWSNFPTPVVPRGGLSLRQMNPMQRAAARELLAAVLSPAGLAKVDLIRQADDDFKVNGARRGPPRGAGAPPPAAGPGGAGIPPPGASGGASSPRPAWTPDDLFGSDLYFIAFLGEPSATRPWRLQFGGHHLALNLTVAGARGVLTPSLTGAQPARFERDGRTVRPLGRESDKALALLQSLDATQRRQAVLDYAVGDLVLGPGADGKTLVPDGLKASAMTPAQRALLLDLIGEWAGIVNAAAAAPRMARLEADLDATWFAWSGPLTARAGENITAYYRVQGPHLVIEYAPQRDEPDNHVHTIYRDPTDDYGRTTLQR